MSSLSASTAIPQSPTPLSTIAYPPLLADGLGLLLMSDPPGVIEVPGLPVTRVSIHVGSSVEVSCRRGGLRHRGMAVHGDIDIIPADTPSLWEVKEKDTFLALGLAPELLHRVAEEFDFDPRGIEIRNRFQIRDPQLENIGWALKAEMECGYPCGRLYLDALAVSVAARLVRCHSSVAVEPRRPNGRLSGRKLKEVLSYIEDNLSQDLLLRDLASVAGMSVSHFKSLFRESLGMPVHQYLIRRRVERARSLIGEGRLSISQIALETGFAHQSHMAHHMRRLLGVSPKGLRKPMR